MDSMRVVTNLLGNCVAVFAVSHWEGALDVVRARKVLDGETAPVPTMDEPETDASPQTEDPVRAAVKEPAPDAG
jgi:aerobic C4-dicarboxylate transport protein